VFTFATVPGELHAISRTSCGRLRASRLSPPSHSGERDDISERRGKDHRVVPRRSPYVATTMSVERFYVNRVDAAVARRRQLSPAASLGQTT
jgi:hypothetical protein